MSSATATGASLAAAAVLIAAAMVAGGCAHRSSYPSPGYAGAAAPFPVFSDSLPLPGWLAPADASPELRAALLDAERVLRKMGGRYGERANGRIVLRRDASLADELPEGRGFVVTVDAAGVVARATDDAGLRQAVYWMLQEWAGARWFWPQPAGEEIPRHGRLSFPPGEHRHAPAYLSRDFFMPGPHGLGETWERRNLTELRYQHHHNLQQIFPRALREREPHLFPMIEGERVDPQSYFWQPNLAHEDVVAHAAAVATGWLRLDPSLAGVSLSINDSMRFDEGPETAEIQQPLGWFRGRPDYSPLVFRFMNRVAERVPADLLAGRTLGAYAYYWTENTPPFPVHPAVMPVLTADRFQYYDREFERNDQELLRRWGRSGASRLMLYEYLEGDAYLVPRQAPEALAAAIRTGHASGARGYFAESRLWPGMDGPKTWVVARLLREPGLDVRALEREFAEGMFGTRAADAYLAYLRTGERIWQAQAGSARWLRGYHDDQQGVLVSDENRALLRTAHDTFQTAARASADALSAAGDGTRAARVRERAGIVQRAWDLCDAVIELQRARLRLAELERGVRAGRNERAPELSDATGTFARLEESMRARIRTLHRERELNYIPDWIVRSSPIVRARAAIEGWRDDAETSLSDNPRLDRVRRPGAAEAQRLAWFEQDVAELPGRWRFDTRPGQGFSLRRIEAEGSDSSWSFEAADGARLSQRVPVAPGMRYRAAARVSGWAEFGTDAALALEFLDSEQRILKSDARPDRMEVGVAPVEDQRLVSEGVAPEGAVRALVSFNVRGQAPRTGADAPAADRVILDQIGLWLVP